MLSGCTFTHDCKFKAFVVKIASKMTVITFMPILSNMCFVYHLFTLLYTFIENNFNFQLFL